MNDFILVVVASLLSGLTATAVTLFWQHKFEIKRMKFSLLSELQSYSANDPRFHIALNKVPLIFNDSQQVLKAYSVVSNSNVLPGKHLEDLLIAGMVNVGMKNPHNDYLADRIDTKPKK